MARGAEDRQISVTKLKTREVSVCVGGGGEVRTRERARIWGDTRVHGCDNKYFVSNHLTFLN